MVRRLPIALCMIVKNEEKYLASCLASVNSFVSEVVIADTGSTDRTVEIATAFGARVVHFDWINDFAAARNFALEHATQPWILQLDADEEILGSESIPWFTWLCSQSPAPYDIWNVEIRNLRYLNSPEVMVTHNLPRFFKNDPELRYQFRIHENLKFKPGQRMGQSNAVIIHKGYADPERKEEKAERNFRMLKEALREKPDDPTPNFYFAQQYFATGDRANGYKAARRCIQLGAHGIFKVNALRMMLSYAVDHGTPDQIRESFALALPPELFPEVILYEGILAMRMNESELAYAKFSDFVARAVVFEAPPAYDRVYPDNLRLGFQLKAEYEEHKGRIDQAIESLRAGLAVSPSHWHNRAKFASLLVMQGRMDEGRQEFERTVALIRGLPDGPWKEPALKNMLQVIERLQAASPKDS